MRNYGAFSTAVGFMAAIVACSGGSREEGNPSAQKGASGSAPASKATLSRGDPRPPFVGKAPVGALRVADGDVGRYGGTLVMAQAGDPKTFNPIVGNDGATTDVIAGPVFSPLWDFDRHSQMGVPGLCERFERSSDGLTYTFTLREGLLWSDGQPLTSEDVAFTFRVVTDPNVPNSKIDQLKQGNDETGKDRLVAFERVDERRFRFKLHAIDVVFEHNLASMYVLPKHVLEAVWKRGELAKAYGLNASPKDLVSSGPFRVKSYAADERVVLERNPYFWKVDKEGNRLPYLDRVVFVTVPDYNAVHAKFANGETDIHGLRTEHYAQTKRLEKTKGYKVHDLGPSFNTVYLMFNQDPRLDKSGQPYVDPIKLSWFSSKRFRKAISHAIDRESMVRTVLQGHGQPIWSFTSPANKRWAPSKVVKYPYDLERARGLLRDDGFIERDGVLHDPAGHKVEFSLMTNAENDTRIAHLNVIQSDLAKLGIQAHVRPVPFNDLLTAMGTGRKFDAILLGWGSSVPPDLSLYRTVFMSSGRSHFWHPRQEKPATPWEARFDTLMMKHVSTFDLAERRKHSDELLYLFSDWQPQIMLVVERDYAAARDRVGNFRPAGLRPKTHWNIEQLYLKSPRKR